MDLQSYIQILDNREIFLNRTETTFLVQDTALRIKLLEIRLLGVECKNHRFLWRFFTDISVFELRDGHPFLTVVLARKTGIRGGTNYEFLIGAIFFMCLPVAFREHVEFVIWDLIS